jgi:hypothetical protein
VAALVRHLELVVLRKFLACLDLQRNAPSVGVELSAGALVERELRVDELAPLNAPAVSSPQVSASFSVRRGR